MNEIITIETLPKIKYQLEQLSVEIKEKVDNATSLVVSDDTVKDVKKVKAELKKEFEELETQRKAVKNAILDKYNEFETIYKANVADLYKNADNDLKTKIDEVESQLKHNKEVELREFASNWFEDYGIQDIVKFEDIRLNITLTASMKSLKEQITSFCERISGDIKLISLEGYKDEIMVEYKKNLNFMQSKMEVINRHIELDNLRAVTFEEEEKPSPIQQEVKEIIEEPVEIEEVQEVQEELLQATFTVRATRDKLKALKEFMKENNIEFE